MNRPLELGKESTQHAVGIEPSRAQARGSMEDHAPSPLFPGRCKRLQFRTSHAPRPPCQGRGTWQSMGPGVRGCEVIFNSFKYWLCVPKTVSFLASVPAICRWLTVTSWLWGDLNGTSLVLSLSMTRPVPKTCFQTHPSLVLFQCLAETALSYIHTTVETAIGSPIHSSGCLMVSLANPDFNLLFHIQCQRIPKDLGLNSLV